MLIAFAASCRGAGKSTAFATAASVLQALTPSRAVAHVSFAWPIRCVVDALLEAAGYEWHERDYALNDRVGKEEPLLRLARPMSGRDLLISLGTTWGRDIVSPQLWLKMTSDEIAFHRKERNHVIIDDLRFPDELHFLEDLGFHLIFIDRGGDSGAPIEGMIRPQDCHHVIRNGGSLEDFTGSVSRLIASLPSTPTVSDPCDQLLPPSSPA